MATTVLALFKDRRDAEAAVQALKSAHVDSTRLGVIRPGEVREPRYGRNALVGLVGGAIGCGIFGALIGFVGTGLVPGLTAWLPGGWLGPAVIGIGGAATGAVAGLLMSQSAARQQDLYYEEEVQGGRTLVSVYTPVDKVDEVWRILLDEGAFEAAPIDPPGRKAG